RRALPAHSSERGSVSRSNVLIPRRPISLANVLPDGVAAGQGPALRKSYEQIAGHLFWSAALRILSQTVSGGKNLHRPPAAKGNRRRSRLLPARQRPRPTGNQNHSPPSQDERSGAS